MNCPPPDLVTPSPSLKFLVKQAGSVVSSLPYDNNYIFISLGKSLHFPISEGKAPGFQNKVAQIGVLDPLVTIIDLEQVPLNLFLPLSILTFETGL